MGAWGAGNFEGDDGEGWLQSLCQPLLDQVHATLANEALLREDIGAGLVPAKLQVLAALWEEVNRADRGVMDTPLFAFSLPSARALRRWRRAYLGAWEAGASAWWSSATALAARRRVIEASFDRLLGIAAAVEQERRQRRAATRGQRHA